jgi:hypothetical protein
MEGSILTKIKIGGREIPLFYSTWELIEIQEAIGCTGHQLRDEVFGIRLENEDDPTSVVFDCVTHGEKTKNLGKLIRILGNAGLEQEGQEPDLTDKWILKNMKPGLIMMYALAAYGVINEGNKLESTQTEEEKGPVDVVLEEENAKKQPGN